MPGHGVQHSHGSNSAYHNQYESEHLSASPYSKDMSPKKKSYASSPKDDACTGNKSMLSEHYLSDATTAHAVDHKRLVNHWWEAPSTAYGSRAGRTSSNVLSGQEHLQSPTRSEVSFEGGTVSNANKDATPEVSIANCSRMASPRSVKGRSPDVERSVNNREALPPKERASRWTDDDGKMVIQSDVFDSILPSSDEVGLQWRISELRIALRASESARLESEMETEALRKYLAEVEAAAAGLQSRVQELEHIVAFSSKDESRELEQLRAKIVVEVSKEARSQTARAAKAVAAAREATMELDKVKRHVSSLIKAQEEEADRLRMEAAECRTLYLARAGQLQSMKEQIEHLEKNLKASSSSSNEALKLSEEEMLSLQKCLDAAKTECQDKSKQLADMVDAYDMQTKALNKAESRITELEREKAEVITRSEWLEQQVSELQSQGVASAAGDYDHEIRKVRAMLGAEKQHLLSELTMLRHGNQNLQVELVEWQEKFHTLSQQVSAPLGHKAVNNAPDSVSIGDTIDVQNKGQGQHDLSDYAKSGNEDGDGQECMTSGSEAIRSGSLCSCRKSQCKHMDILEGHYSTGRKSRALQQRSRNKGNSNQTSCNLLKDDLLAAAHREIVKLKEINQCLLDARHGKTLHGNNHPEKENFSQK